MQYLIILVFGFLFIFTGCSSKRSSDVIHDSSPLAIEAPTSGYGGDILIEAESSDVSPAVSEIAVVPVEPAVVPSPVPPSSSVVDYETDVVAPIVAMPTPPQPQEVQSGILTAADIDDNLNLGYFQKYINKVLQSTQESLFPFMRTKDRVKLTIEDTKGKGINRVKVKIGDFSGYTNSQGILYLFPSVDNISKQETVELNGKSQGVSFETFQKLSVKKELKITLEETASLPNSLDLMFVVDSTGSMGDEMRYLAKELDAIVSNVKEKHPDVQIRFGLTLYRDKGDDYVVRDFEFTADVKRMKEQLEKQSANGGGDYPEAMDEGIEKALKASWQAKDGVRMMFLVADAPPHDEKIKQMVPIIEKARERGIHIYPLGASGVAEKAEYIMRHLALFTQGRYLWLTDDSGVGNSHAEPKVNCYQVTRLDQLMSRIIQSELSGKRVEAPKDSIIKSVGNYQNGICQ